jgi:integrase
MQRLVVDGKQPIVGLAASQEIRPASVVIQKYRADGERRLILCKKRPNHAKAVKEFTPKRLVCWLQDELKRYNAEAGGEPFTLHDFRRTAITGFQMAIAKRSVERCLQAANPTTPILARRLRAGENRGLNGGSKKPQPIGA